MIFEKTDLKELDAITQIVSDARSRIGRLGIDQWQYGYPSRDVIAEDIRRGRSYVARDEEMPKFEALVCFSDSKARLLLVI